ncbi:MAG: type IX secretion system membrane protein PorP/SprF [Bacteroidota bacterium]
MKHSTQISTNLFLVLKEELCKGAIHKSLIIGLLFFAFISNTKESKAQDMHFTQFFSSPLYLNPAFAGAGVCSRVSTTYRNQWPGISKTYKSYLLSADHYLQTYNLGIGLLFGNDAAGSGELKTVIINPMVAYEVKVNRKYSMRFGVQPGVGMKSINFNKLLFGDQIARGGNVATLETPTQSKTYFDIGAGGLFYSRKYWIGTSVYHLTRPDVALMGNSDGILPIKYSVHGGAKFIFNPKERNLYAQRSVSPAFNYRGQREFDQFDIGLYFTQYIFNLGLWYRGIPILKSYKPGYANNDVIAMIVGIKTDRLNIGYSFDYTISKLNNLSHGAHEITLSYQLCKFRKKKKSRLVVPCPKF